MAKKLTAEERKRLQFMSGMARDLRSMRARADHGLFVVQAKREAWRWKMGGIKTIAKSVIIAVLLMSCVAGADAAPVLHRCTVYIERATPDELVLELWSTSQSTTYSADINYGRGACCPWDGHEENWVIREKLASGCYVLPWADFYDRNPRLGMEACINWTCQPEVVVIYWSQDYQAILNYLFLPLVRR